VLNFCRASFLKLSHFSLIYFNLCWLLIKLFEFILYVLEERYIFTNARTRRFRTQLSLSFAFGDRGLRMNNWTRERRESCETLSRDMNQCRLTFWCYRISGLLAVRNIPLKISCQDSCLRPVTTFINIQSMVDLFVRVAIKLKKNQLVGHNRRKHLHT
jgi:hypothetical protein